MNANPILGRLKRRQFVAALAALTAPLLPAIPARALIGVTGTDSAKPYAFPYVGTIWTTITCCFDPDEDNDQDRQDRNDGGRLLAL